MILGVCGYGFTGSGAILDLLKDCRNIHHLDVGEFNLTYIPDGLEDLEYHLMVNSSRFFSSDVALYRFLERVNTFCIYKSYRKDLSQRIYQRALSFVNEITQVDWYGIWGIDELNNSFGIKRLKYRIGLKTYGLRKKILSNRIIYPEREMRLSISPVLFDVKAKEFIRDVLHLLGYKDNYINLVDQPFSANTPQNSFRYFDNPKAIIIDRDPRDLYLLAKQTLGIKSSWIPVHDVNKFIEYYQVIHQHHPSCEQDDSIVYLRFEDLIYNYSDTIKKIESILGMELDLNGNNSFDPNISINNTQLFKVCPPNLLKDIRAIESSLKDSLFDFDHYSISPNRNHSCF